MRIKELHLKNWRVIRDASFEELGDFVVVAGPNGVGKTKVKEAIVHIFANSGNPPPGSRVVLEATNDEEKAAWKAGEIVLPQPTFWSLFGRNHKRLKTKSRLIQIDSSRSVESIQFQQLTFQAIGNPEEEEVGQNYGYNNVRERFKDICATLQRIKSREVTSVYKEYQAKVDPAAPSVTLPRLKDHTERYIELFGQLLYPKTMLPIDITSSTINYRDDDGQTRQFSELSSGEREVVVLTFDILTQNPEHCLILIDEPEVHLHPELAFRLIKVLRSIGERNQFFLFTHSADIIGNSLDTGIHFIRPKAAVKTGNQVVRVDENNLEGLKTIPNIRETIGMVSVGKKLLFVEGKTASIDRNVFATIAKASKIDVAIIPSDSCSNINNMALMCEMLEKGLLGVELFMVRDRDGLTQQQIDTFTDKSRGKLLFLPFYHIENAFLDPHAIDVVARKILLSNAPSLAQIEDKLKDLARHQINRAASLYVKSEIYFKAGNFDVSANTTINESTRMEDIAAAMAAKKDELLARYSKDFSGDFIKERLYHWRQLLETSIQSGWSVDARRYFIGKQLLREIQNWLFGSRNIVLWEHIISTDDDACRNSYAELRRIVERV